MLYRRFGRTELRMPLFSCGGMRYQQSWSDMPLADVQAENQRNLEATIRRSLELGVNHIETARGYGSSERQLGVILPEFPRDDLIVQTKIGPELDPQIFRRHFEESLERLRLGHVELLAIHGVNNYEHLWQTLRPGGCLEEARKLQREGKARHIGFSTHASLPVILDAVETEVAGGFDYVNLHWYYINQWNWPAVEAATQRDMGVFIISPSNKGGMLYEPPQRLVELCSPLHPLVFNCLFCLARPEVHTLSLGAARPSDFDLQLSSLELLPRAAELLPPIVSRLQSAMIEAAGEDVTIAPSANAPPWETAPGHINTQVVLWLRSLAAAYGMTEYAKMRYNLLGAGGHWFAGLNSQGVDEIDPEKFVKACGDETSAHETIRLLREAHQTLGGAAVKRESQS